MELTWSLDYCLACDRQVISGGAYCSQSCRVTDLETSTLVTSATTPSWASSESRRGSNFYLTPAINFNTYMTTSVSASPTTSSTQATTQSSCFGKVFSKPDVNPRTLTPSSSRSSLKSTRNDSAPMGQLSEQVHNELRAYANSFDTSRNWRRRMTWS